ncbi:MAG: YceD family protein [Pedobacter sp.]|nr:YceD family protein [Pedobacter sp.]
MSTGALPQYIDAQKWADREAVINQVIPLSGFVRLCEGAASNEGEVSVNVRIHRDAQGLFVVDGEMSTQVALVCQRCLEPVMTPIDASVQLWLLRDESVADRLPDDADYLVLDEEGRISLADALEDELILALPLVAAHDDCEAYQLQAGEIAEVDDEEPPKRENPFQVLAGLKTDDTKKS